MKKIIFLLLVGLSQVASAGTLVDFGATYLSDSFASPTTSSSTNYFFNLGVLFNLDKRTWGGWNFSGISSSSTNTTTTTYSSQDTGPFLKWQFGKSEVFNFSFAYNIQSKATFSDGTTNETWSGTSYWLQWGISPEVREGLHIGFSLNYYGANYNKKVVNSTETAVSNTKTWIFPMFQLTKQW